MKLKIEQNFKTTFLKMSTFECQVFVGKINTVTEGLTCFT